MIVKELMEKLSRIDPDAPIHLQVGEEFSLLLNLYFDDDRDLILSSRAIDPDLKI